MLFILLLYCRWACAAFVLRFFQKIKSELNVGNSLKYKDCMLPIIFISHTNLLCQEFFMMLLQYIDLYQGRRFILLKHNLTIWFLCEMSHSLSISFHDRINHHFPTSFYFCESQEYQYEAAEQKPCLLWRESHAHPKKPENAELSF